MAEEAVREVLQANDAFYAAFSSADLKLMDALWAREHTVTCTHPGRAVLESREAVMASWHLIFRSGQRLRAAADGASVCLSGAMAVVTCYERLRNTRGEQLGVLAATNVFVREGEDWKLVHHHASGLATDEDEDDDDAAEESEQGTGKLN